jgi:teichuronic acid biosynthesis glycosyltransferase TuaH
VGSSSQFRPVIYVATNHDWFSYHHFYQGLASAFARTRSVLYVGGISRAGEQFRQVDDDIWLLNAKMPKGANRRLVRPLSDRLLAGATQRALSQLSWSLDDALVWTYTTDAAPLIRAARKAPSVYWTGDEVVDKFEPSLLRAVRHVFTVSPAATALKRSLVPEDRVTEMPIATDPTPYRDAAQARKIPEDLAKLPRPWFGYGGAVNARTDWDLVDRLARSTPGTVVIVGPAIDDEGRRQMTRTDKPDNLVFLGHRDAAVAPDYIAAFDVGLIPYRLSAFNLGSNPVKTYDYLAAGIPVVTTDLPAIRPLAPLVVVAETGDEFIARALEAARLPVTDDERARRQSLAAEYSYDALVARIDDALGADALLP